VETNRSCPKGSFGWSHYKKAPRRLTVAQTAALTDGHLRPLLDYALDDPEIRFDIRPGKVNLYYDGGSLLRLQGGTHRPPQGAFDLGYVGESGYCTYELSDRSAVLALREQLADRRRDMDAHREAGSARAERRYEQRIAHANDARSMDGVGDFVIFDIEYSYARRRFDFAAIDVAGLPRPRLILGELKCRAGALNGTASLQAHGEDFAELVRAENGRHVTIVRDELADLICQKQRLGLLAAGLGFEGFSDDTPEFLVMFADFDVGKAQLQTPLSRLYDEVDSRLGNRDLLKFAHLPQVEGVGLAELRLRRESIMDSDAFDAYRQASH
jgi:hypothetical protein